MRVESASFNTDSPEFRHSMAEIGEMIPGADMVAIKEELVALPAACVYLKVVVGQLTKVRVIELAVEGAVVKIDSGDGTLQGQHRVNSGGLLYPEASIGFELTDAEETVVQSYLTRPPVVHDGVMHGREEIVV